MKHTGTILCIVLLFTSPVCAQPINGFAELETILGDQILLENFEGISLHSGGTLDVPNPLNSITIQELPWNMTLEAGITYESPTQLQLYAGFNGGNENISLRAHDGVEMRFDFPQVAFGLTLLGSSQGNAYSVSVYDRNDELIEAYTIPSDNGATFCGYQSPTRGIARVNISHPQISTLALDDVGFGLGFVACPADMNGDLVHDVFDVFLFLDYFNAEDDRADFTDDGQFDVFDVFLFIDAIAVGCP